MKSSYRKLCETAIEQFNGLIDKEPSDFFLGYKPIAFPILTEEVIRSLCEDVTNLFAADPIVYNIDSPVIIVGDLHGHILDLFRIFRKYGKPQNTKYLFLGDIVDRGEFSLEISVLLFLYKLVYPENICIIRGNHEFTQMCSTLGFKQNIFNQYESDKVFNCFIDVFNYLPLAAILFGETICVHGGIGPTLFSISQISAIQRPIQNFDSALLAGILWSDPTESINGFQNSIRGIGFLYGKTALESFLKQTGTKMLIRAHECVQEGVRSHFGGIAYTVFSASNYCGTSDNMSGIIEFNDSGNYKIHSFPAIPYLTRDQVKFVKVDQKIAFSVSASALRGESSNKILKKIEMKKGVKSHTVINGLSKKKILFKPDVVKRKSTITFDQ